MNKFQLFWFSFHDIHYALPCVQMYKFDEKNNIKNMNANKMTMLVIIVHRRKNGIGVNFMTQISE